MTYSDELRARSIEYVERALVRSAEGLRAAAEAAALFALQDSGNALILIDEPRLTMKNEEKRDDRSEVVLDEGRRAPRREDLAASRLEDSRGSGARPLVLDDGGVAMTHPFEEVMKTVTRLMTTDFRAWTGGTTPSPLREVSEVEAELISALFRSQVRDYRAFWGDPVRLPTFRAFWRRARADAHATVRAEARRVSGEGWL